MTVNASRRVGIEDREVLTNPHGMPPLPSAGNRLITGQPLLLAASALIRLASTENPSPLTSQLEINLQSGRCDEKVTWRWDREQ
jgi:hypothetical protein